MSEGVKIDDRGDGHWLVSGRLELDTATAAWRRSRRLAKQALPRSVDLSDLTEGDSGALALMLEWSRWAAESGNKISFEGTPAQLRALAHLCGVDGMLGLQPPAQTPPRIEPSQIGGAI